MATATLAEVDDAVAALTDSGEQGVMTLDGEEIAMSAIPVEQLAREREILTGALQIARAHMLPFVDVDPAAPDALDAVVSSEQLNETLATWPATVSVARRQGAAVYSDDRFVRLSARREGVPAFSTLALLTVLHERDALSKEDLDELRLELGRRGVWGMRPSVEELRLLAAEQEWQPSGGWTQALADPAAWLNEPTDQLRLGLEFLRQLHTSKPDELEVWTARLIDIGRHASDVFDAADVAALLLAYAWFSPGAFADLEAHRPFAVALVRALRAASRRLLVAAFDDLIERSAAAAIFSIDPRLRGEMFKWILRQVTFLDAKLLFDFFL